MADTELFLFTIDSLRRDHFTKEHFPSCWETFDADFARFENALSNGVATPFSFPSIVTGHQVVEDGTLNSEKPTLAQAYDGDSWAITNNPHLRPERGYHRGFDFFSDNLSEFGSVTSSDGLLRTIKRVGSQISVIRSGYNWFRRQTGVEFVPKTGVANDLTTQVRNAMSEQAGFFWAHFMDPHYPFRPDRIIDKEIEIDYSRDEITQMNERFKRGEADDSDLKFLRSMYGETIRYLDRALSDLFDYIKSQGRWNDSILVIMSDHGEAFGEQGVYNHMWDADPIDSLIRVPLLVKFPDCSGESFDHLVQNSDLFPTLAAQLDWDVERPPQTRRLRDTGDKTVISKSNTAVRVTTKNGYAVRRTDGTKSIHGELDEAAEKVLEATTIPTISQITDGVTDGESDELPELEERLEHLGYK